MIAKDINTGISAGKTRLLSGDFDAGLLFKRLNKTKITGINAPTRPSAAKNQSCGDKNYPSTPKVGQ